MKRCRMPSRRRGRAILKRSWAVACVASLFAALGAFALGYLRISGVSMPLPGDSWFAVGSVSGSLVLVWRTAPDGASGEVMLRAGGSLPLDSKGRLDITAPHDVFLGPSLRWREYTTRWSLGSFACQTGREASSGPRPGGWSPVRYSATDAWVLAVPWWPILLLTGTSAVTVIRRHLVTRRRRRAGQCLYCGYDLRASGERCPECGTATPKRTGATA